MNNTEARLNLMKWLNILTVKKKLNSRFDF